MSEMFNEEEWIDLPALPEVQTYSGEGTETITYYLNKITINVPNLPEKARKALIRRLKEDGWK